MLGRRTAGRRIGATAAGAPRPSWPPRAGCTGGPEKFIKLGFITLKDKLSELVSVRTQGRLRCLPDRATGEDGDADSQRFKMWV